MAIYGLTNLNLLPPALIKKGERVSYSVLGCVNTLKRTEVNSCNTTQSAIIYPQTAGLVTTGCSYSTIKLILVIMVSLTFVLSFPLLIYSSLIHYYLFCPDQDLTEMTGQQPPFTPFLALSPVLSIMLLHVVLHQGCIGQKFFQLTLSTKGLEDGLNLFSGFSIQYCIANIYKDAPRPN